MHILYNTVVLRLLHVVSVVYCLQLNRSVVCDGTNVHFIPSSHPRRFPILLAVNYCT